MFLHYSHLARVVCCFLPWRRVAKVFKNIRRTNIEYFSKNNSETYLKCVPIKERSVYTVHESLALRRPNTTSDFKTRKDIMFRWNGVRAYFHPGTSPMNFLCYRQLLHTDRKNKSLWLIEAPTVCWFSLSE